MSGGDQIGGGGGAFLSLQRSRTSLDRQDGIMTRWGACVFMHRATSFITIFLACAASAAPSSRKPSNAERERGQRVLSRMAQRACDKQHRLQSEGSPGAPESALRFAPSPLSLSFFENACGSDSFAPGGPIEAIGEASAESGRELANGKLLARKRVAGDGTVAMDIVAYASSGLAVGGLLCYPDDGRPHSTVIHVHGGFSGLFDDPFSDPTETCIDWAALHGRTVFFPSFRGQDGGEGVQEFCLGEADDVAASAAMLRSLKVTKPSRIAMVGGSMGACVALRAAPKISGLRALVAFVPPTDWKRLVEYHRFSFVRAVETTCDGGTVDWNLGGREFADTIDRVICGHPKCTDAQYAARSPIPSLLQQKAPTLIMSAASDNIVPFEQQILWSVLREQTGHPVRMFQVNPCDPSGAPPHAMDVHIVGQRSYHLLSPQLIGSGLTFLLEMLDRPSAANTGRTPLTGARPRERFPH
jgi:pimeloyl-ACP methyl ester carboxylesterase